MELSRSISELLRVDYITATPYLILHLQHRREILPLDPMVGMLAQNPIEELANGIAKYPEQLDHHPDQGHCRPRYFQLIGPSTHCLRNDLTEDQPKRRTQHNSEPGRHDGVHD